MSFSITMCFFNIFIPILMIIAGYMMYKHPPKEINGLIGYRTARSTKNMDTWLFAHKVCGRLWFKIGLVMLFVSVIIQILVSFVGLQRAENASLIIEFIQMAVLVGSIFPVETALKRNFDDNGKQK